jgi:serine/threonine protein kinase
VLTTATWSRPPQVKICDFGLSKYRSSSISQRYSPSDAYTEGYMSPERLLATGPSSQDDVYAFGILMYFIASSRTPFSNFSERDIKKAVIAGKRPDIQAWAASSNSSSSSSDAAGEQELVEAYCDLAQHCWHQDPRQRPSCEEILSQLSQL